jgi:hypothetical protein
MVPRMVLVGIVLVRPPVQKMVRRMDNARLGRGKYVARPGARHASTTHIRLAPEHKYPHVARLAVTAHSRVRGKQKRHEKKRQLREEKRHAASATVGCRHVFERGRGVPGVGVVRAERGVGSYALSGVLNVTRPSCGAME